MQEDINNSRSINENRRVHLSNERTFLSWIRTSIAVIGFGFLIQRFSLFMTSKADSTPPHDASAMVGVIMVAFGAVLSFFSYVRFVQVRKMIDEGRYRPTGVLNILITLIVLITGGLLAFFLFRAS